MLHCSSKQQVVAGLADYAWCIERTGGLIVLCASKSSWLIGCIDCEGLTSRLQL